MKFDLQCPFCKGVYGVVVVTDPPHQDGVQVKCSCGARGPVCPSAAEAIDAWTSGIRNLD